MISLQSRDGHTGDLGADIPTVWKPAHSAPPQVGFQRPFLGEYVRAGRIAKAYQPQPRLRMLLSYFRFCSAPTRPLS